MHDKILILMDDTTFLKDRNTIKEFISRVRRVQYLADISGVSKSTVERTFKIERFEELSGNMLIVWENAIKMYEDFEMLRKKTRLIAESIRSKKN